MTEPTVPDTIERSVELPHPVERVWAALTDPAEFGRWFCTDANWELRPGAPMVLRWNEHGTAAGEIVTVEPTQRFAFRWGSEGVSLEPGQSTLVEFTLTPSADGGTTLRVLESGFSALADGATRHAENTQGWTHQFDNIARYLLGA